MSHIVSKNKIIALTITFVSFAGYLYDVIKILSISLQIDGFASLFMDGFVYSCRLCNGATTFDFILHNTKARISSCNVRVGTQFT